MLVVGQKVSWVGNEDNQGQPDGQCENGLCVGKVVNDHFSAKYPYRVKWDILCNFHEVYFTDNPDTWYEPCTEITIVPEPKKTDNPDKPGLATEYGYVRALIVAERGKSDLEDIEDMARETAIHLISLAGYGSEDLDLFGSPMGDAVQTALMVAFMRQPDMVPRLREKE